MSNLIQPELHDYVERHLIDQALIRARQERSAAFARIGRAGVNAIAKLLRSLASPHDSRPAHYALWTRAERMLDDIGLSRGDIEAAETGRWVAAGSWLGRVLAGIGEGYRAWQRRQATRRELEALDDRMLKDIGITRAEIASVARGHRVYRGPATSDEQPYRGTQETPRVANDDAHAHAA